MIHSEKGISIGHFGARIKKFFDEICRAVEVSEASEVAEAD